MPETILQKDNEELRFLDNINIENRNNFLTQAEVISVEDNNIIVKVTDKCTTSIPLSDVKNIADIKPGVKFDVFVEQLEDSSGQIVVSRSKAEIVKKWKELYSSLIDGIIVNGVIKDKLVGGVSVDINGITAFLPASQIENTEVEDLDNYIGKDIDVIVTKINSKTKNVIVSHKLILDNAIKAQEKAILSQIEKGQIIEGIVDSIVPYGAFVNIGGISGLLHITDIAWTRINHPNEVLKVGDKIKVVVTECDSKNQKISFGLKYLTPSPWETIDTNKIKVGQIVEGKVVNVVDFGAFIEVVPGIEGLLHVSDLSWNIQAPAIKTLCKVGDVITTKILDLNIEDHKLSLGLKQLSADPWASDDFDTVMALGSKHLCEVIEIKPFGAIVKLENGLYGLIHETDFTWTKKPHRVEDFVKLHEKVEAVVLSYDKTSRKLSLGLKQLKENPWETYEQNFKEGSLHEGVVLKKQTNRFIIQLEDNMIGLLKKEHIPANIIVNVGDKIPVKVVDYDKNNMKINVVHEGFQYKKSNSHKQTSTQVNKKITFGDIYDTKE